MTWVKVCGLTRSIDVEVAVAAGADAVGFVIDPASRRCVDLATASRLAAGVPVSTILVAVDLMPDRLLEAAGRTGVSGVQPHGRYAAAAAAAAAAAGLTVLRPVAVSGPVTLDSIPTDQIPLLDTASDRSHGGTGRTFDWALVQDLDRDFVLAGGLRPDNVARAIEMVAPWGVDASSGLEIEAGIKDPGKVTAFVQEAKNS